jgi:hypothetical protein
MDFPNYIMQVIRTNAPKGGSGLLVLAFDNCLRQSFEGDQSINYAENI